MTNPGLPLNRETTGNFFSNRELTGNFVNRGKKPGILQIEVDFNASERCLTPKIIKFSPLRGIIMNNQLSLLKIVILIWKNLS